MDIEFHVTGHPVPQGSMTAVRAGKYVTMRHQQGGALAVWRQSIRLQCEGMEPTRKPVSLALQFRLKRPKAHLGLANGKVYIKPQYAHALPNSAPDLDKLIRAVMDALTGVLYYDDSQVALIVAQKVYSSIEGLDAKASDALGVGTEEAASASEGQGYLWPMPEAGGD